MWLQKRMTVVVAPTRRQQASGRGDNAECIDGGEGEKAARRKAEVASGPKARKQSGSPRPR